MERDVAVFLHLTGVVLLIGNVTVTSVWKVFADRTGDARLVAFAQRMVTITDFSLTLAGVVLLVVGGYWAAVWLGLPLFESPWLIWSQVLFAVSGAMWLGVLVPIQVRQARATRSFDLSAPLPAAYKADSMRWIWWGVAATVPLVAALWLMIAKP